MIALLLMKKIVSLFLMIFSGFLIVKLKLIKSEEGKFLSIVAINIVSPCMILSAFQTEFTPEVRNGLFLAVGGAIIAHIMLIVLTELLSLVGHFKSIEKASIIYTNCGNLIIPVVLSIMGDEYVIYCCAYLFVQNLLIWTHCVSIISGEHSINLKKLILNINMISIFIGVILFFLNVRLPGPIGDAVNSVGSMIGPISMIITGMLIGGADLKAIITSKRIWIITFIRLILLPIIILYTLKYLPLYKLVEGGRNILLITNLAVMAPAASTVTQLAQIKENNADYAGSINVLTTLLCIGSMPLLVYLYQL